jgi:tRNA pseudouridine13 synthase
VKVLTEIDTSTFSIFDVVMPLPGKDVEMPGGPIGKLYREFLVKDGLDPDKYDRKQK